MADRLVFKLAREPTSSHRKGSPIRWRGQIRRTFAAKKSKPALFLVKSWAFADDDLSPVQREAHHETNSMESLCCLCLAPDLRRSCPCGNPGRRGGSPYGPQRLSRRATAARRRNGDRRPQRQRRHPRPATETHLRRRRVRQRPGHRGRATARRRKGIARRRAPMLGSVDSSGNDLREPASSR